MVEFTFVVLGLFFLSVMETIQHHFWNSIFSSCKIDGFWFKFWYSDWENKYDLVDNTYVKKTGVAYVLSLFDGYHVSKWLMITCFIIAAVGFDILLLTYCFSAVYVVHYLFYNKIFMSK